MTLTREQVLAEPVGERLDRWVAEYVMGFRNISEPVQFSDKDWFTYHHDMGFYRFSANISAAFEALRASKLTVEISGHYHTGWSVIVDERSIVQEWELPKALCKAVLLAVIDQ